MGLKGHQIGVRAPVMLPDRCGCGGGVWGAKPMLLDMFTDRAKVTVERQGGMCMHIGFQGWGVMVTVMLVVRSWGGSGAAASSA